MGAGLLPHVTASLNGLALVAALIGFVLIRLGRRDLHRPAMLTALGFSALFLVAYLLHHFTAPIFVFRGQGLIRPVYYVMLVSHVLLSIIVTPLILLTLRHALAGRFTNHTRLARWVWPVWVYVSASGLLVYLLLYHLYP